MSGLFGVFTRKEAKKKQLGEALIAEEDPALVAMASDSGGGAGPGLGSRLYQALVGRDDLYEGGDEFQRAPSADEGDEKDLPGARDPKLKAKVQQLVAATCLSFRQEQFFIFEPRGFVQKVTALLQNTIEIWLVIAIAALALALPSLVSCGFLVLSHDYLITATMGPRDRLKWGYRVTLLNLFMVLVEVCKKVIILRDFKAMSFDTLAEFRKSRRRFQSEGFALIDVVEHPAAGQQAQFSLDTWSSFFFELLLVCVYLGGLSIFNYFSTT